MTNIQTILSVLSLNSFVAQSININSQKSDKRIGMAINRMIPRIKSIPRPSIILVLLLIN